jgi:hypothetical protein
MAVTNNLDIFSLLALEKQNKVERKAKKDGAKVNGNIQTNSKLTKNGGQPPATYN